jgi:hypothetical protein
VAVKALRVTRDGAIGSGRRRAPMHLDAYRWLAPFEEVSHLLQTAALLGDPNGN